MDAEKAWPGNGRPRVLEREESADLPDEAQATGARGFRFVPRSRDVRSNDLQGDNRVNGSEVLNQKPIKPAEGVRFVLVAAAGRPFELEEAFKRGRDRRGEIRT